MGATARRSRNGRRLKMNHLKVEAERVISASPEDVYAFLADYAKERPKILPPNFLGYAVEEGGHGAGTVVSYRMRAGRRERPYRMRVDEPARGVLTENDAGSSFVTRWELVPTADGERTRVRLVSEWDGASGVAGFFERLFAPVGLRRVYNDMLARLAAVVEGPGRSSL
jgi:hypothetical protein